MMDDDEEFNGGYLLRDIEEISKALYLNKNPPVAFIASSDSVRNVSAVPGTLTSKPKVISSRESPQKDKKSSIWKWRPLKALSHMRSHRFSCYFFLHVHAIEGLPLNLKTLNLCVTWKRKNETLRTRPAPVYDRMAEFEETLMHRCTVYASTNGTQNLVNYEPKLFLLQTYVVGAPSIDIGKHWIDLTRLLPLTLEDLKGEQRRSGKWTTSFKLRGKAEGAMLNVSFGFSISDGNPFEPDRAAKVPGVLREGEHLKLDHNVGSAVDNSMAKSNHLSQLSVKSLDELFSSQGLGLGQSINLLYQKLDEERNISHISESLKSKPMSLARSPGESTRYEDDDVEYTVVEQGVEVSMKDQMGIQRQGSVRSDSSLNEIFDALEIFKEDGTNSDERIEWPSELDAFEPRKNASAADHIKDEDDTRFPKEPMVEKLNSDCYDSFVSWPLEFDSLLDIEKLYKKENCTGSSSSHIPSKFKRSLSLVDKADSIEDEFLKMLSISRSPTNTVSDDGHEFPEDCLVKQSEEHIPTWGKTFLDNNSIIAQPIDSCCLAPNGYATLEFEEDFDLEFGDFQPAERHDVDLTQSLRTRTKAKMLENMETESLMHEWGLDEDAFQNSPHSCSGGFGSPVYIPEEEPLKLPSLGEGIGPIIQTRSGGFLRSMNPLFFTHSQNGARLIVQVSAPVVLPLSIGSTAIEVLQYWASFGVEKMSAQVKELMPLEDITEKSIQEMVSETTSRSSPLHRCDLQNEYEVENMQYSARGLCNSSTHFSLEDMESEYASLENLVPLAIKDIEGLLIEGLKIQSGFQDQEAPSSTRVQFYRNSASIGNRTESFQLIDIADLVSYAVPLEEWVRLGSGDFGSRDEANEHIVKVFAAHSAKSIDSVSKYLAREEEGVGFSFGDSSHFHNNFTMALKVQLRDPLRNYEMVGPFMLALVEVERVDSKLTSTEEDCLDEKLVKQRLVPKFKVLEVNLSGLSVMAGNNHQLWSTSRQQQSGSRWLLSSGLAMKNKHPTMSNSNAIIKLPSRTMRKIQKGEFLWSISSQTHREASTWNDLVALHVHVRNPDIIFPVES